MALFKRQTPTPPTTVYLDEPAPPPRPVWGSPTPCAECGGPGYVDHIDIIDRIMYQHCRECGHKWQLTERELSETP